MSNYCDLAAATARKALDTQIKAIRAQAEPLKSEDSEAVHDMRVASRRLRTVLTESASLFDKPRLKKVRQDVRRITGALGRSRELDVSIALLESRRKDFHGPRRHTLAHTVRVLRRLRAGQSAVIAQTVALVESDEFLRDLQALAGSLGGHPACHLKNAASSTAARFAETVKAYACWKESDTEEDLHQLRIAFKKLRYTCEIYCGIYGPAMNAFIKSLKDAQQWLGEWHDYCVIIACIGEAEPSAPHKAIEGIPALRYAMAEKAADALEEFTARAEPFFATAAQEKTNQFLQGLYHECVQEKTTAQTAPQKTPRPANKKGVRPLMRRDKP